MKRLNVSLPRAVGGAWKAMANLVRVDLPGDMIVLFNGPVKIA